MKVIFLQDVQNVAKAGEVKEVTDGYARNFLMPRKLALVTSPGAVGKVEARLKAQAENEKLKKTAAEIEGKEITLQVKMGAKERMHGSITGADIAAELQKITGVEIDKRKIDLEEPIKKLGNYELAVKLAKDITPKIKVNVIEKEKEEKAE
jgi:large subunit ribosomal protein L9